MNSMLGFHRETARMDQPRRMRRRRPKPNPNNTAVPSSVGRAGSTHSPVVPVQQQRPARTARRSARISFENNTDAPVPPPANATVLGDTNNYATHSQIVEKVARWRQQRQARRGEDEDLEEDKTETPTVTLPEDHSNSTTTIDKAVLASLQDSLQESEDQLLTLQSALEDSKQQVKKLEQDIQQILMEQKKTQETVERLNMQQRAHQEQVSDVTKDVRNMKRGKAEESKRHASKIEHTLRDERHAENKLLEANLRTSLQEIHDKTNRIFGTCQNPVKVYCDPDLNSPKIGDFATGSRILLIYPMRRNIFGVWMRTMTVESNARLHEGWVPIFQFEENVIHHYKERNAVPPDTSPKTVNVCKFSLFADPSL